MLDNLEICYATYYNGKPMVEVRAEGPILPETVRGGIVTFLERKALSHYLQEDEARENQKQATPSSAAY